MADLSALLSGLKIFEDYLKETAKTCQSKFDRITFTMLVDGLKNSDAEAVKVVIDQLVKEKRSACIAPLYVVSEAYPAEWIRKQAKLALNSLVSEKELSELTTKDIKESVRTLSEKYGSYRQ